LSQIDPFAQIDYSLVSSPAVFKSHINMDLKGTVYPVGNHTDPPFVPAPFGLPNKIDSMLYLGVSNYFLKSATLAYYRAGVFNITISKDLATAFNLTTAILQDFVPEIALHCQTACPVLLKLTATSPPVVNLQSDTCGLWITGSVEVFAVLPNSTIQYIFTGNLRVPRHLFIRLKVIQLSQPCRDLNDTDDKEAIRAVLSLHSGNKYQRQFDSNQTEADHLNTSEEAPVLPAALCCWLLSGLTGGEFSVLHFKEGSDPNNQCLLSVQLKANPGLKVRITQKGLEYAKKVGVEILKENMEQEQFPDLIGYERFGLGNVHYNISRIRVTAVEFPNVSISLIPRSGVKLVIRNASLTINMNWNIRTWMFFLHDFFIKYLKKPIHRRLAANSCPNIRSGIQMIAKDFQSLNGESPVMSFLSASDL
ncbi:hypothetical protein CIB84_005930, partial [Bambusicola thoracicus]